MISEWKTEEWHFKVNGFNSVKCLYKTTSDWEMEIDYGKPYPEEIENDLTGVMPQNSQQKSVPDLNVLTVAFLALKKWFF